MSLPRDTMLELMALADGELEGQARERAERLVADSQEARRVLEAMRGPELGTWLEEAESSRVAAADGIADAVMAKVAAGVSPSAAGRPLAAAPHEDGGVVRLAAPRRGRAAWVPVVTVLALAAGAALVVRSVRRDETEAAPVASVTMPGLKPDGVPAASSVASLPNAWPKQGVEVDEIDSPSRGVSVFEIPMRSAAAAAGSAAPSSVVIWIDEEPRNP